MAFTPPPPSPSTLRVPTAPRHGAGYDQFEPYPTRYSARLAGQRALRSMEKTPPPNFQGSPSKMRSKGSPKKCRKVEGESLSPPGSNAKQKGTERSKDHTPSLAYHDPFTLEPSNRHSSSAIQALPTPAKTPSKKKVPTDLSSTSRALFPSGTMMPSKKKSAPFSLESFETPARQGIDIWTDSRDRIPVHDPFMENPFSSRAGMSNGRPVTRSTTRELGDGPLTYTFRGKKVLKHFEEDEEDDPSDLGLFASRPDLLPDPEILKTIRPLSRKDIKPRILWPEKTNSKPLDDDPTDIEDNAAAEPSSTAKSPITTPLSPEFPRAPGATRFLRSNAQFDADFETTPSVSNPPDLPKRGSPFNQWRRKKKGPDEISPVASPAKREADGDPESDASLPAKKTRSSRVVNSA